MKKYSYTRILIALVALVMVASQSMASPSGLNNIPTADVAPEKTLVLQTWVTFADDADDSWVAGLKYGLLEGLEVGADQQFADGTGELTLQAKWQIPKPDRCPVQSLIGIANVSGDTDKAGDPDPYAVFTYAADWARLHLGYSFQDDNSAIFGGIDATFSLLQRDLVLRSDIKEVMDGEEHVISAGLLYVLPANLVFEGWGSFPSADAAEDSVTLKLNYVIEF